MVNKVACFLTCGYTEAGEMQGFLQRCCQSKVHFVQCMPNKPKRKRENDNIIKDKFSGLTHESLVQKMMDIIKMNREQYKNYKGIVFEDDLDDISIEEANTRSKSIRKLIRNAIGDIPVVVVYAAPEIESWFIADWNNGFGIYKRPEILRNHFSANEAAFLDHHMRNFFKEMLLGEYSDKLEKYGEQRPYRKLSDEIIHALDNSTEEDISCSFRKYLMERGISNPELVNRLIECKYLRYSKKDTGSMMLRGLDPKKVAEKCQIYFAGACRDIAKLGD